MLWAVPAPELPLVLSPPQFSQPQAGVSVAVPRGADLVIGAEMLPLRAAGMCQGDIVELGCLSSGVLFLVSLGWIF